jgi:hypothetical protein
MRPRTPKRRPVVALAVVAFALAAGQAAAVVDEDVAGCKVTYGGWITTAAGDQATFGGNVNEVKGSLEYQDHGPSTDVNVHSKTVTSGFCVSDAFAAATITGIATVDGEGSYEYTLDLVDSGEPGRADLFRLRLSNGYDSGEQPLLGGNIQIHKQF